MSGEVTLDALGQWCCDNSDGHEFDGDYKFDPDGSVELNYEGHHYALPASMVLKGPSPTGHAVWWYVDVEGAHIDFCFAPGAGG